MKRLSAILAVVSSLAAVLLAPSLALAAPAPRAASHAPAVLTAPGAAPESAGVIVKFKDASTAPLAAQLVAGASGSSAAPSNAKHGLYTFRRPVTAVSDADYAAQLMLDTPGIAYAEPDYRRYPMAYTAPTDPAFTDTATWYESASPNNYFLNAKHWWLDCMNASGAWSLGQGDTYPTRDDGTVMKVGVIDTGLFLTHSDASGGTFAAGLDECASYNPMTGALTTDTIVTPDATGGVTYYSHGTGTSTAVGAEVNGVGMVGSGWNPQVRMYKVSGLTTVAYSTYPAGTPWIPDSAIVNAIYDATNAGCKVLNLSLGSSSYSQAEQDAVTYAYSHGVVVVASAGNDSGAVINYPAADAHVISVAALTRVGGSSGVNGTITKASFSDYAPGVNDLSAAGEMFWTGIDPSYNSGNGAGYYFWAGTSFSSPAVAGAISYLWRAMPDLTPDQITSYVESSAVDLGAAGRDDTYGYGLVDMQAAYNKMIADYPTLAAPSIAATYVKPSAVVTWTASSGYNVSYLVSVDGTLRSTQAGTSYTLPGLSDGAHLVSVLPTSTRNWNSTSTGSKTVTVDSIAPVVSGFSNTATTAYWSVAEANPYTMQARIDSGTASTVASTSIDISGVGAGSHTLYVNATDAAGNSSGWVAYPFTSAGTPPSAPALSSIVVTDALSATVSWPVVGGATSYDYTVNGGSAASTSGPSVVLSGLTGGSVTTVTVRSVAGTMTSSWSTATVTDQIVVPAAPSVSAASNVATPSVTATWPVAANARSYEWRLNGGTATATTATSAVVSGLSLGANSVSVRALDNFAQSAWTTVTVTYAVTPPVVPSVVVTDALAATVSWTAVPGAASYDYQVNGGSVLSTAGTSFAVSGLTGGLTPVQVRTVRANGDASAWTAATVTDNVVVPGTPAISLPATTGVPSVTASWGAASNARSYEWRVNGGASTATTGTSAAVSGLSLGANSVSVRSLNNLSASAWATSTVTFAVQAPAPSVPATVWASTATVSWAAVPSATGYEYAVNGGSVSATSATSVVASGLVYDASNTITVRTVQGANSSSWATATVYYSAPSPTTLTLTPPTATVQDPATSTVLTVYLAAPAETFRLQSSADGSAWSDTGLSRTTTATPASVSLTAPVSAKTYFRVVFDGDSRWAPAVSTVTTVTYVPTVAPPALSSFTVTDTLSAVVTWPAVSGAASYEYRVNGESIASTSGAAFTAGGLNVGANTVDVRTLDGAANRSIWSTATITVALLVPEAPVLSVPPTVGVPGVGVSWPAVTGAISYEYRLDSGSAVATTATGITLPLVTVGGHTVEVRALDNLSQSAWASANVTYAVPAPVLSAPSPMTTSSVDVTWGAIAQATAYEYRLNGSAANATTLTSATIPGLALGDNLIEVRALQGGNASPWSSATVNYRILGGPTLGLSAAPRVVYPASAVRISASLGAPNRTATIEKSIDGGHTWSATGASIATTDTPQTQSVTLPILRSTTYRLVFAGDSAWEPAVSANLVVAYLPRLNLPSTPSSIRHGSRFTASLTLTEPALDRAATVTFRFERWQKSGSIYRWVALKSVRATGSVAGGNIMRYRASTSLTPTGTWRVTGAFAGGSLYAPGSSAYRALKVR